MEAGPFATIVMSVSGCLVSNKNSSKEPTPSPLVFGRPSNAYVVLTSSQQQAACEQKLMKRQQGDEDNLLADGKFEQANASQYDPSGSCWICDGSSWW